jgi:hypothetical protein
MAIPTSQAVKCADRILNLNPTLHRLSGRHIGIVGVHAELWSGLAFRLDLRDTGVASGHDAVTTQNSPDPFAPGQSVQIKGRARDTIHVTFRPAGVDWLIVVAYKPLENPVVHSAFVIRTEDLVRLARDFESEFGEQAHPVRFWKKDGLIRLEWWELFETERTGAVGGSNDTWEARRKRSVRVLKKMYLWKRGVFLPVPHGFTF